MFYECGLRALEKAIVGRNDKGVDAELANLDTLVKQHNTAHPEVQYSMSTILSRPFSSLNRKDLTPLEFAVVDGSSNIAASLRKYGAPETSKTSYFPGFWNTLYSTHASTPVVLAVEEEHKSQYNI